MTVSQFFFREDSGFVKNKTKLNYSMNGSIEEIVETSKKREAPEVKL